MLIAHYPLNGDARDYFGNDGTSTNVTWVDGKIGQAAEFNGNDGSILTGIPRAIFGNSWSVSLWCYFNEDDREVLASSWNSGGVAIEKDTRGRLRIYYNNSPDVHTDDNAVPINSWNHCVFIRDVEDNSFKIYIGGILVKRRVGIGGFDDVGLNNIRLGGDLRTGLVVLDGMLDDVRIYDHALSEKEVINLYRANYLTSSLRTSSGINLPNVTVAESAPLTYDNGFIGDGSGRIVHTGHDAVFTELTISLYFRLDLAAKNYVFDTNTSRDMIFKVDNDSTNTIQAGINGNYPKVNIGELIGREVHFVMTYDGAVQKIFADGIKVSESSTSGAVSLGELYIGGYYQDETYDFNGKIRDLQFFAREFSEAEVSSFSANAMSVDNIGNMHSKHLDESPKVRYIRETLNGGNTSNDDNHWLEIKAFNTEGVNVALDANAYDSDGAQQPLLTDGITSGSYINLYEGEDYVEVDLGGETFLDTIQVWHYYSGASRYYHDVKLEVSVDGVNWVMIFDSIVDGTYTETSSGKVHQVLPASKFSVNYSGVSVGEASEVGISRGLVSWLPLIGDTKDRVTNEVATNNGATPVGDGYEFDGSGETDGSPTGDYISIPEAITNTSTNNYPEGCTYSVWLNVDTDAVDRMGLFWGSGTIRHIEIYSIGKNFRTEAATQNSYSFGSSSFPDDVRGVWSNFTIVFANGEAGRPVRWYQNGKLFHTGSMTNGSNPEGEYFSFSGLGRATGGSSYTYAKSFDGKIRGFRIYGNTLTPEEVAQEYNSGKASLNKNSAFAKEFIEV